MSTPKKVSDQLARFKEAARELECDDDPKAFERVFAKIVPPKVGKPVSAKPSPVRSRRKKTN